MRAAAVLALVALALTGCESSQQRSAQLEREAKAHAAGAASSGLRITAPSRQVRVVSSTLIAGGEASAAVVRLRNTTASLLRDVPLLLTVRDGAGATVYSNGAAGLAPTLTHVALIPPHSEVAWVDDQVQASGGRPASVSAEVGQAPSVPGPPPRITVSGAHLATETSGGTSLQGTVTSGARVPQHELAVYALASRGGRVVAAGRAVLTEVAPGAQVPFQVFFVGSPGGAAIETSAPATTLG